MNRSYGLGRLKSGSMNKTEQAYAAYLNQLQTVGGILWHKFEGMKLRLADNTFTRRISQSCALTGRSSFTK